MVDGMGLVHCQDCGREVSQRAESCPQCGAPIQGAAEDSILRRNRGFGDIVLYGLLAVAAFPVIVFVMVIGGCFN